MLRNSKKKSTKKTYIHWSTKIVEIFLSWDELKDGKRPKGYPKYYIKAENSRIETEFGPEN